MQALIGLLMIHPCGNVDSERRKAHNADACNGYRVGDPCMNTPQWLQLALERGLLLGGTSL